MKDEGGFRREVQHIKAGHRDVCPAFPISASVSWPMVSARLVQNSQDARHPAPTPRLGLHSPSAGIIGEGPGVLIPLMARSV